MIQSLSPFSVRPARLEDAEALSALSRETFYETFVTGFGIPYPEGDLERFFDKSFSPDALRERLAEPKSVWWVGVKDQELLGLVNAGPNTLPHPDARPTHMELRRLYVARKAQGIGLGKQLLTLALDWMQDHTDGPTWIGVWSGNHKAQALYQAYGYTKVGDYLYPVGSWNDHEFILRRN